MATPDNGKNIISSVNNTLNYLLSNKVICKIIVVDADGNGNYTSIKDAVDANNNANKLIYVKAGTYTETGSIILKNQSLIGESPFTTKIIIDSTLEMQTPLAAETYSTGTITLTKASTNVLGGGTTWSPSSISDYNNPWLISKALALPISTVVDASNLTLENRYEGVTEAGLSYFVIDAFNIGSKLSNFDITHSVSGADNCLEVSGINCIVENNIFNCNRSYTTNILKLSPSTGVSINCQIKNNQFHSGINGISIENCFSSVLSENKFYNQVTTPIISTNDNSNNEISYNKFFSSGSHAIVLANNSSSYKIVYNEIIDNSGVSLSLGSGCDNSIISNNIFKQIATQDCITSGGLSSYVKFCSNKTIADVTLTFNHSNIDSNFFQGEVTLSGSYNSLCNNDCIDSQFDINGNYNNINDNTMQEPLADLAIDVNGVNCNINNNILIDVQNFGIATSGSGFHNIIGNSITSAGNGVGIQIGSVSNNVSNNIIKDCGDVASIYFTSGSGFSVCNNNKIEGGDSGTIGILVETGNLQINNNHIYNLDAADGIKLDHASNTTNIDIKNNFIKICAIGIIFEGNDNINIIGNTIHTPSSHGIHAIGTNQDYCSISNNSIIDAGGTAIYIDGAVHEYVINSNIINNPSAVGIYLTTGNSSVQSTINSNKISSCGANGITLDSEAGTGTLNNSNTVSSNSITNCSGTGIAIGTHNNVVNNNFCLGNSNGIYCAVGDFNIINGNNCQSNTGYGIQIVNTSDRIIITCNIALSNGTGQINDAGTNTVNANNIVA